MGRTQARAGQDRVIPPLHCSMAPVCEGGSHVRSPRVCSREARSPEDFRTATVANARTSLNEPGVARFDVIQQQDDPTRFLLVDVYRTAGDPARYKETTHYQRWRDSVADMMAEPRTSTKYTNVFPENDGWS